LNVPGAIAPPLASVTSFLSSLLEVFAAVELPLLEVCALFTTLLLLLGLLELFEEVELFLSFESLFSRYFSSSLFLLSSI